MAEALDEVGLSERADDQVKTYSLGMKQRLGIAGALLKDPEVLILDEPANGLDPAGIVEVRELMRHLGREGRTVFVSSHILSEVQQTADRVAILARGRSVATGPVADVLSAGHAAGLIVRLDDPAEGLRILATRGSRLGSTMASSGWASRPPRRPGSRGRSPTVACTSRNSGPTRPTSRPSSSS